jgi:hypothetical protein
MKWAALGFGVALGMAEMTLREGWQPAVETLAIMGALIGAMWAIVRFDQWRDGF